MILPYSAFEGAPGKPLISRTVGGILGRPMRFPRTPLASALAAALLLTASSAPAQDPAAFDVRRAADYDASLIRYVAKRDGYVFNEQTGILKAPDGHVVTKAEADGAFYDEGPWRLTEAERRILVSQGFKPATRGGRAVLLEPDCDAAVTPLRLAIIRYEIRDDLMGEASEPFNAKALDAETAESYVKVLGMTRDGNRFLDHGKVLTHGDLARMTRRVDAEREPDVAAIVSRDGYVPKRRGGVVFLWSPESGWLDRVTADLTLKAYGLQGQRDPLAPFKVGKNIPDAIKAVLSRPPGSVGPDGTVTWEGAPLTVAQYTRLLRPVEPGRLTAAEKIYVEMAQALGYDKSPDGKSYVLPDGKSVLTGLDAATIAGYYGLTGQHDLDAPFDSRLPGAALVTKQMTAAGVTVNPADGTVVKDGRVLPLRDVIEMFAPFDLNAKLRQDPRLARALESLLKGYGFDSRVVGNRTFMCQPNGGACITNQAMRGNLTGLAAGQILFTKTGLIAEQLKMARAGKPVPTYVLARIDLIAHDKGGYLPPQLAGAIRSKKVTFDSLTAALEAGAEEDARAWAAADQIAPARDHVNSTMRDDLARTRALAARDGATRLSEKMERAFSDLYREQDSRTAADMRAQFVNPGTGKSLTPFLALGTDSREGAHFESENNLIVFMVTPQLAKTLADVAAKSWPAEKRTADGIAKLAKEYEDPAKLGPAMLADEAVLAAFAREQAWNYIHEHGHALSSLKGPAAVERKGLMTAASWTDEEKVAFLWETRYTHEILSRDPRAKIPPVELQRYNRMLSGYSLWSHDIIRDHLDVMPGNFATLPDARRIQADWIARAKRYVAEGKFPGAATFLERLEKGAASMKDIAAAYDSFFDQKTQAAFTRMAIEGDFNMASRYAAPGPDQNEGVALSYRAVAPVRIANAVTDGQMTAAEAAVLKRRLASSRDLLRDGFAYAQTWRAQNPASLKPAASAAQAAQVVEAVHAYFVHLEKNPALIADSGMSPAEVAGARATLKIRLDAIWAEYRALTTQEKAKK